MRYRLISRNAHNIDKLRVIEKIIKHKFMTKRVIVALVYLYNRHVVCK